MTTILTVDLRKEATSQMTSRATAYIYLPFVSTKTILNFQNLQVYQTQKQIMVFSALRSQNTMDSEAGHLRTPQVDRLESRYRTATKAFRIS